MACSIKQNDKGQVISISYKGVESQLYPQLKKIFPNDAPFQWAMTRTSSFKEWYGLEEEPKLLEDADMYYFQNTKNEKKLVMLKGDNAEERTTLRKVKAEIELEEKAYKEAINILGDNPINAVDERLWQLRKDTISWFQEKRKAAINFIQKSFNITKDPVTGKYKSPVTDAFNTITNEENGVLAAFINKKPKRKIVTEDGKTTWEKDERTYIEREADEIFGEENNTEKRVDIPYKGKILKLNKEEYKEFLEEKRKIDQEKGKLIHLAVEKAMAKTKEQKDALEAEYNSLLLNGHDKEWWHKKAFNWLDDVTKDLKSRWNLSSLDAIHSEQIIYSELLNIAGRADFVIRYEDGRIGIRDIKTSKSLRQDFLNINNLMKHGNTSVMQVENTRLNQAKLQVFLYAFTAKVETEELQFKNLGVDWVASPQLFFGAESDIVLTDREIKAYLEMIEAFYKEQQANKENNIYTSINRESRPDLWNVSNYTLALTDTKELVKDAGDLSMEQFEAKLQAIKLAVFYDDNEERYLKESNKFTDKGKALRKRREQLMKDIEWLYNQASSSNNYLKSYDKDLSLLAYYSSTSADTRNNIVHLYERLRIKQQTAFKEEWYKELASFETLMSQALNSMRKKQGLSEIPYKVNPLSQGIGNWINEYFSNYSQEELWGWAYKEVETIDGDQFQVMKTIDDLNADDTLTEEQKRLGRFLNRYYENWFKDKDGKKAYMNEVTSFTIDSHGKETPLTVLDVYNGKMDALQGSPINRIHFDWNTETEFIDKDKKVIKGMWFPKTAMLQEEYEKKNPLPAWYTKEGLLRAWRKNFTTFFEDQERVTGEDQMAGLPLRFLGTTQQKINRDYSINLAQQFINFGMQTTRKKHMDLVYAWGKATVSYLREEVRDSTTNKEKLKYVANFIEKNIKSQLGNKPEEYDWFGGHIRFKGGIFSPKKLIMWLRRQGTATLMFLNPLNSFVNWLQTINRSIISGWSEAASHSKILGATDDWLYPSVSNYAKAYKDYWTMNESLALSEKDDQKLKIYLLAQHFGFLPDDSDWSTHSQNVFGRSQKWASKKGSIAYFMMRVPEEANAYANLGAQLRQMKIKNPENLEWNGKSIYDGYEVVREPIPGEEGVTRPTLKWIAGERGTRFVNGKLEKVFELEAEEIIRIRNVYKTLQGGYRHDEKTILEMTILGELFMQFKKYLPSLFKLNLQTEAEDLGLGNFDTDENGIMQWKGRSTEGRWWTLARLVQTYSGIMITKALPQKFSDMLNLKVSLEKQLRWSEMSDYQKYAVAEWMITMALWAPMSLFLMGKAKSDNDDDSYLKYLKRINDNIGQPYSVNKMWEAFADMRPVSIKLMQRRVSGYSQLTWSGLLWFSGNEDSALNQKGELKGLREALQTTPVVATAYQLHRFVEKKSMDLDELISWNPR